jgi:hypothetical protein
MKITRDLSCSEGRHRSSWTKEQAYLAFFIVASVCGFGVSIGHGIFLLDFFEMRKRKNTTEHHEKVHLAPIEIGRRSK